MLGVVIQIDAREAGTGLVVPLRAASHDDAAVCHLTDQVAWPVIARLPKLGYDLFDGAFEGRIATPSASMSIGIEPWPTFARLAIADTRFRLWTGEVGAPLAAWTQRVDARVTQQPVVADGRAELTFAVDDRWLDRALLATYAGTTGAEGPAALKGQAKPLALGAPRYVPGVLVDPVNSLFQVSGHGAIVAIDAALERLLRYGPPVQDYASVAELLAAAIPAGRWATALSGGWARFGAPPTGQVCFMVRGDVGGPDGWSRLPGQQIRRLALLSGGVGRIADASLNALDAARPYNLSLYLDQQTTARELIQEVAASVNAVAGVSWMGRLFVQPVEISVPTLKLAADGSALPAVAKVRQLEISPPFGKLAITAERTWSVHQLGDIAFTATLVDMGAWDSATTYREGNIVQQQGSTWVYINPVPSAGNAPPPLPTISNAYWRVLARAGETGASGASAFTLIGNTGSALFIEPDQVTKIANSEEWQPEAVFRTAETFSEGCQLSFYPGPNSGPYFDFGLWNAVRDDAGGNGGIHADWTWHVVPNGNANDLQLFNRDTLKGTFGKLAGQMLGISYDNRFIVATINGLEVARFDIGSGRSFHARGAIKGNNHPIARITWVKAGARGESAPLIRVQWSIDGVTNWHDNYFGADVYQRQSNDGGATWGPAYRIIGENGTVGQDGSFTSFVFKRSASIPATPADNSGNPPAGWTDGPPDGTDFLWQSKATFRAASQLTSWTSPVRISGEDGFVVDTETTTFSQPVFSTGANKPAWTGGSGTIRLTKGGQRITDGVGYAVLNNSGVAGLAINGDTFSFSGAVDDIGAFTIRATYNGQTYDKVVSVKKVYDGEAAFKGAIPLTNGSGTSSFTVPAGRQTIVSGQATYQIGGSQVGTFVGTMAIYWRNKTDNGPTNFLGQVEGTAATSTNTGTPGEPVYDRKPGTVSAAFSFVAPSPSKEIEFSVVVTRSQGNATATILGTAGMEVRS